MSDNRDDQRVTMDQNPPRDIERGEGDFRKGYTASDQPIGGLPRGGSQAAPKPQGSGGSGGSNSGDKK